MSPQTLSFGDILAFAELFFTLLWNGGGGVKEGARTLDQLAINTPNHKCRLYWCLLEFTDWRYSQSCWYFQPLFWTITPQTFSLVHLPPLPPPFPEWKSILYSIQCEGGGEYGVIRGEGVSDRWTPAAESLYKSMKTRHLGLESISYLVHAVRIRLYDAASIW